MRSKELATGPNSPVLAVYDLPVYACPTCKDRGITYEGSGHRMAGYPYAEKNVIVSCSCAAGKRLDAQEAAS